MNRLVRFAFFVGPVICVFAFGIHNHLKLMDCQSDLLSTVDSLKQCVAERDGCRQGVHEFMAEMEKLKTQTQAKVEFTPRLTNETVGGLWTNGLFIEDRIFLPTPLSLSAPTAPTSCTSHATAPTS